MRSRNTTGNQASFCNHWWIGETADYHTENIFSINKGSVFLCCPSFSLKRTFVPFDPTEKESWNFLLNYFYLSIMRNLSLFLVKPRLIVLRVPYFEWNSWNYERQLPKHLPAPAPAPAWLVVIYFCTVLHWLDSSYEANKHQSIVIGKFSVNIATIFSSTFLQYQSEMPVRCKMPSFSCIVLAI